MNTVRWADCPLVPWKNGGGRTRELLAWPRPDDWRVRVSVAEIDADGPFSAFPGVDRCFAVLDGAGVVLSLPDGDHRVAPHGDALTFAGEAAPACRLVAGPTRDLNLMVRRGGGHARLQRAPVAGPACWRGLYAGGTLWWTDDPFEALPALTDAATGWHLAA